MPRGERGRGRELARQRRGGTHPQPRKRGAPLRIALIVNAREPRTRWRRCGRGWSGCARAGHEVRPRLTFEAGDAERMAREARGARGGPGDRRRAGTAPSTRWPTGCTRGWRPRAARRAPRLGIVPLGTGNDLARGAGDPEELGRGAGGGGGGSRPGAGRGAGGRALLPERLHGRLRGRGDGGGAGRGQARARGAGLRDHGRAQVRGAARPRARASGRTSRSTTGPSSSSRWATRGAPAAGNWLTPRADPADGLLDLCVVKERLAGGVPGPPPRPAGGEPPGPPGGGLPAGSAAVTVEAERS